MHSHTLDSWQHEHVFLGAAHERNERRTWAVVGLTTTMMVVEIAGGMFFGSMALLADGWHMSTHAGALAIAAFAYRYARRHAHDPRFAFGTGKLGDLAGFASAVVLATGGLQGNPELLGRYARLDPANLILRSNPWSTGDAFIAATALVHGMTVATRNLADFARTGATLLNPWSYRAPASP